MGLYTSIRLVSNPQFNFGVKICRGVGGWVDFPSFLVVGRVERLWEEWVTLPIGRSKEEGLGWEDVPACGLLLFTWLGFGPDVTRSSFLSLFGLHFSFFFMGRIWFATHHRRCLLQPVVRMNWLNLRMVWRGVLAYKLQVNVQLFHKQYTRSPHLHIPHVGCDFQWLPS